jgi:Beta-lactamase
MAVAKNVISSRNRDEQQNNSGSLTPDHVIPVHGPGRQKGRTVTQEFFVRNVPDACYTQMKDFHAAGTQVLSIAFPPNGTGWVVIPSTGAAVAGSLPTDCEQALASLQTDGAVLRCVAFAPGSGWFMSNSKGQTSEHGLPTDFDQTLSSVGGPAEVACVAFNSQGGWVVANQKGQSASSSTGMPSDCLDALKKLAQTSGGVRCVAFPPASGWVAIGNDGAWFGGDGVSPQAWMYLSYYSSLLGPLTFAAFTAGGGWAITSDASTRVLLPIENWSGGKHLDPLAVFESLRGRLIGNAVGWAAVIGSPSNVTSFAQGYARTTADSPEQLFLPSTKWQTASTSKVLTAITTIAIVDKLPKPSSGNSLDIQIKNYLPDGWQVATAVQQITFGELLSHTSGIQEEGGGMTYDQLQQYFENPSLNLTNKSECYTNIGYGLLRLLIPVAAGFNYPPLTNPLLVIDPSVDPNNLFSTKYVELVNQYVFAPVGVTGMNCEPPSGSDTYALTYEYPGTSPGYDWTTQDGVELYLLAGPGGWWVSLEDMVPVMTQLSQGGGSILTSAQWDQMLNIVKGEVTSNPNGWDHVKGSVPPYWIVKNGGVGSDSPVSDTTSVFAIFGTQTWGVAVANSDICGPDMQRGWQWCHKCTSMWYTVSGNGACPAGTGGHSGTNSWDYLLSTNSGESGAQSNWRLCSSCESIWYAGSGGTGHCVGTGKGHQTSGSSDYSINIAATGTDYPSDQQSGWQLCRNCLVLNMPGSATGTKAAPLCAAGIDHDNAGSKTYWLQSVAGVDTLLYTAFQAGVRP